MTMPRILVLEDDEHLQSILLEALTECGYEASGCRSFAAALQVLAAENIDLLLADYWGTGQARLGKSERDELRGVGEQTKLVLLTGRAWAREVAPVDVGAVALLGKPFDLDALLECIEGIVPLVPVA